MSLYSDAVIRDGAMAYWRLGETSGSIARDELGLNNGTISGGVTLNQDSPLSDGSRSMLFNGSTGKIDAGNIAAMNFGAGSFTIEAWINLTTIGTSRVIVAKGSNSVPGWRAFVSSSNRLTLFWGNDAQFYSAHTTVLAANAWYHAVWGYNATAGAVFYSLNGNYQSFVTVNQPVTNAASVTLGTDTAFFLSGNLDEVAVYPTALSQAQISQHYSLRSSQSPASVELGTGSFQLVGGQVYAMPGRAVMVSASGPLQGSNDPTFGSFVTLTIPGLVGAGFIRSNSNVSVNISRYR